MPAGSDAPRILLADDDDGFRIATAMVLRAHGLEVTAVGEGNHAILAWEVAVLGRRPFDLLLLDLRMPGASGWEVLSYVRRHPAPGRESPRFLLVTGFATEPDVERMRRSGADGILLKPIPAAGLLPHVRRSLALRDAAERAAERAAAR